MLSEHERSFRNGGGRTGVTFCDTDGNHCRKYRKAVCTETDGKFMGVCQNDHRSGRVGIIIFVSIILLVNDFDKLKEKASHSIGYRHFVKILKRIFHMGGMFLKAQLIIMSVIAALCTVTFLL